MTVVHRVTAVYRFDCNMIGSRLITSLLTGKQRRGGRRPYSKCIGRSFFLLKKERLGEKVLVYQFHGKEGGGVERKA